MPFPSAAGLISSLTSWPHDFFQLLTSSPSSSDPTMSADYSNAVLHFGEREFVVLGFWKMGSGLGLAASMLVVTLMAILHEAVLGLRFFLEREQTLLQNTAQKLPEERPTAGSSQYMNQAQSAEQIDSLTVRGPEITSEFRVIFRRVFSRSRMLQALLYFIQWALFVFAFVLVPCGTFNVPLILAALLGKTIGYLVFIGSPAMESVERISPLTSSSDTGGPIRLATTRKSLRSF